MMSDMFPPQVESAAPAMPKQLLVAMMVAAQLGVSVVLITVFLGVQRGFPAVLGAPGPVSYAGAALASLAVGLTPVLLGLFARQLPPADAPDREPQAQRLFLTMTIIRFALLEGGGVLNAVAYSLEGWAGSLVMNVAILVAMVMSLPTPARFAVWSQSGPASDSST